MKTLKNKEYSKNSKNNKKKTNKKKKKVRKILNKYGEQQTEAKGQMNLY